MTLGDLILAARFEPLSNGRGVAVDVSGLQCSRGNQIPAQAWFAGIQFALESNPLLRRLASALRLKISPNDESILAASVLRQDELLDFLSVPLFAPLLPQNRFSGRFAIRRQGDAWLLSPNVHHLSPADHDVSYAVLRDPWEAVKMFDRGRLDQTPESSLPLELWNCGRPHLRSRPSDLFGFFSFSSRLSRDVMLDFRMAIFRALEELEFSDQYEGRWQPVCYDLGEFALKEHSYEVALGPFPAWGRPLVIGYDDYYPNEGFAQLLGARIATFTGVETKMQKVSYSADTADWDAKFHIVHFYGLGSAVRKRMCLEAGSSFAVSVDGDEVKAEAIDARFRAFPVSHIPLRFLQREEAEEWTN